MTSQRTTRPIVRLAARPPWMRYGRTSAEPDGRPVVRQHGDLAR